MKSEFTPLVPHGMAVLGTGTKTPEPPIELTDPTAILIQKLTMTNIMLDRVNYNLEKLLDELAKT